ncbi:unnamed protein product [Caenorhabditis auriculariae]|uniref:Major facilitator superfamily (MFS) profile domain-containing protein n=1 Tax=Caenorhabditis auriculariae TaxID=2777116 RepID=A0A8S1GV06_9PELO|nr:unnamed protein product [Caenorhabditis auriculariae]
MSGAETPPKDEPTSEILTKSEKKDDFCSESGPFRTVLMIAILLIINTLNYMDRYTVSGVLTSVQTYYSINDSTGGLIHTVFLVFYMFASPFCGFLSDRYNRKWIIFVGIAIWVVAVLGSTFVPPNLFWVFLLMRGLVGIGEASYSVVAPTVIADMFTDVMRSRMLMLFYFAIPVGSGLGFIVGSVVSSWTGQWQWGIRITAILGFGCLILIILFFRDPERGRAEKKKNGEIKGEVEDSSYFDTLVDLCSNVTFITSTIGYTAIIFVVGMLAWWLPTAILQGEAWDKGLNSTEDLPRDKKISLNFGFGATVCFGGIFGVALGTTLSFLLKKGLPPFFFQTRRADALVCALGSVFTIPVFFFLLTNLITENGTLRTTIFFLVIIFTSFNWATNVDLLMSVVIPQRRGVATSYQFLLSHLFGDGSSPYLIGLLSDSLRGSEDSPRARYDSLVTSFKFCFAPIFLSGVFFLVAAYYTVRDQDKAASIMGKIDKREGRSSRSSPVDA